MDGQLLEQATVTVGIWESLCSPDGRTCSAYVREGSAIVPAEAITIAANLASAVMVPVEVTTTGWSCESWFDEALGSWQNQCTQITQMTTGRRQSPPPARSVCRASMRPVAAAALPLPLHHQRRDPHPVGHGHLLRPHLL